MKLSGLLLLGLLSSGCVFANPPETKYTVRVVDAETGLPITNALVKTTFTQKRDPWGKGVGKSNRVEVPVDQNGEAILSGRTIQIGKGGTAFADEYYADVGSFRFTGKSIALNRWEPWNPTVEIKMRPKKNPVSMVHKKMLRKKIPAAADGSIGYDLEIGDWIAPHGKGKITDFLFTITKVNDPKEGIRYALSFSNPLDGIQEYVPPEGLRSSYIFPYQAPTSGYMPTLEKYRLLAYPVLKDYPANNLKNDKSINYIFRTRTKVDEDGNIVSANYGRIKGEVTIFLNNTIDLGYWFNPEPNNRSLESLEKPY